MEYQHGIQGIDHHLVSKIDQLLAWSTSMGVPTKKPGINRLKPESNIGEEIGAWRDGNLGSTSGSSINILSSNNHQGILGK